MYVYTYTYACAYTHKLTYTQHYQKSDESHPNFISLLKIRRWCLKNSDQKLF